MKKVFFLFCIIIITSCQTLDVFEKIENIQEQKWSTSQVKQFTFTVEDTTRFHNFYMVLRHGNQYPYKNIWLELNVKSPNDTIAFKKEFILADNTKWLGTTMDDIVDHRVIFNPQPIQLKKGTYTFSLKQIMRDDPLPFIYAVGVRVQKTNP